MGRADHVAAVAGAVARETIDRFGVPSDRVSVIPVGVDESRIRAKMSRVAARSELGLPPKAPVILSLGALAWEKDPVGQLEAVATVLEEVPEARYIVAGDGELRTQVESLAAHRHLGDRVMTVGERLDVSELFAAADTLVLASRTEGLPGVIIEAGMAGIPAAAYAVGGVSEVVREGETGLLASPGDRRGLTEALRKLVGDAALRRRLGTTARQRYRERYSIGVVAGAFLALYRELAAA
jgi:glycosyltransferase involved in cell wall biosynthesis